MVKIDISYSGKPGYIYSYESLVVPRIGEKIFVTTGGESWEAFCVVDVYHGINATNENATSFEGVQVVVTDDKES